MPLFGYVAVALLVPHILLDTFFVGIISAVVYSAIMSAIFLHLRADIFNTGTFIITTLAFNYWLFSNVAPFIGALT